MRKSILLIGNHPPPFGGVPTHIEYLASHLSTNGWSVYVLPFAGIPKEFTSAYSYEFIRPRRFSRWINLLYSLPAVANLESLRLMGYRSPRRFWALLPVLGLIRREVLRNDIQVISAYHLIPAGLAGAYVSSELSVPLVTSVFGEIYDKPDIYKGRLKDIELVCSTSRKLLSCSDHCARSYEILGLSPEVETVYYGTDTEMFSPNSDGTALLEQLGIDSGSKVILFVGRMVQEMGLQVLLDSIPSVLTVNRNVCFIIAGARGDLVDSALTHL